MSKGPMQKAANKRLPRIVHEYGLNPIVVLRSIPYYNIVKLTARRVTYINECGETIVRAIATVDHYIPLSDGGGNEKMNLVPACSACNSKRNDEVQRRRMNHPKNSP